MQQFPTSNRVRPPPEECLTEARRDAFDQLVGSMPPDWFVEANVPALVQLARHVTTANHLAAQMQHADVETYVKLAGLQATTSAIIVRFMRSLRLTPRSIQPYRTAAPKLHLSNKPWRSQ